MLKDMDISFAAKDISSLVQLEKELAHINPNSDLLKSIKSINDNIEHDIGVGVQDLNITNLDNIKKYHTFYEQDKTSSSIVRANNTRKAKSQMTEKEFQEFLHNRKI